MQVSPLSLFLTILGACIALGRGDPSSDDNCFTATGEGLLMVNSLPGPEVGSLLLAEFNGITGIDFIQSGAVSCTRYREGAEGVNICTSVLSVNGGTLVAIGETSGLGSTYAITGGTGNFIGASGEFSVQSTGFVGSDIQFNFEITVCP